MFTLPGFDLTRFVRATLDEDLGLGLPGGGHDVTSESVIPADARFSGVMDSREPVVVAGPRPTARELPPRVEPGLDAASGVALDVQALDGPALVQTAAQCQACGLCAGRKNTTLAMPDPAVQADWLVVGDPPDEDEDRQGQPFVQQAGQLLDNMLKAVGASRTGAGRQGAYLSNVVKCRPPQGRLPQAAELAQCAQYLEREIAQGVYPPHQALPSERTLAEARQVSRVTARKAIGVLVERGR